MIATKLNFTLVIVQAFLSLHHIIPSTWPLPVHSEILHQSHRCGIVVNVGEDMHFATAVFCRERGHLSLLGEHGLLERDAELLADGLELLEVLLVLALVLDLVLDACVCC